MNKMNYNSAVRFAIASVLLVLSVSELAAQDQPGNLMTIGPGSLSSWKSEGNGRFDIQKNDIPSDLRGISPEHLLFWRAENDSSAGILQSEAFIIKKALQEFEIAGLSGVNHLRQRESFRMRLRAKKNGEILRETNTNGYTFLTSERWYTPDLIGQMVYLEIHAPALENFFGVADIWMAMKNYHQKDLTVIKEAEEALLQGIPLDENASLTYCRTLPFLAAEPGLSGNTVRIVDGNSETIPVNAHADVLYLLGMINHGWENGVAHWGGAS